MILNARFLVIVPFNTIKYIVISLLLIRNLFHCLFPNYSVLVLFPWNQKLLLSPVLKKQGHLETNLESSVSFKAA